MEGNPSIMSDESEVKAAHMDRDLKEVERLRNLAKLILEVSDRNTHRAYRATVRRLATYMLFPPLGNGGVEDRGNT
jgi:hypothetical protein